MKSRILVDHDLEKNEPFIQLSLALPDESDLTDKILKHFVESANQRGVRIIYPEFKGEASSNFYPQIRLNVVPKNVEEFEEFAINQLEVMRSQVKSWIGKEHEATDQIFDSIIAKVSVNLLKR